MNIVYVSTLYYPFLGGIEVAVQKVAESLVKLGYNVSVLTSNQYAMGRSKMELLNNVRVSRVKALRLHYPYLTIPVEDVSSLMKKADIVHGWGHTYYFVYSVLANAKKLNRFTVTYFIGVDYLMHHHNPLIRFVGSRYQKMITRRIIKVTDLALVTNDREKKLLEERYGVKSILLPHGVDAQYLETPNMAKSFRREKGIEGKIVAFIGRIHPTKGLDLLIRAFAEVAKDEPDLILLIAGKGEDDYLNKCLNLAKKLGIENKVKYLGYLSEKDKIGLIDASEIVVIPSKHPGESFPLTVNEVKARGKPLVVTNYGNLPYMIVNYVEGVVVNADVNSLAKGIRYALTNTSKFRVLSKPYTWDEIARKLVFVYESIIGRGKA